MSKPSRFICIFLAPLLSSQAHSGERDILDMAKERPLGITVNGIPAKYGDPDLAAAVDGLAIIPHPWTVPKMIELFHKETSAWLHKKGW